MHSPLLELIDDGYIYISGEVIVDPSAAIATGVLLQADPGSRLTIAAGVCIGQGTVLHAHQGTLAIEAGAILGSGVLIIGQGKIGANACVGPLTTIINASVKSSEMVPAHSLIGDKSRSVELEAELAAEPSNGSVPPSAASAPQPQPTQPEAAAPLAKPMAQVYGQAYLERIMIAMFPHRQSLNNPSSNDPPQPP
jgi:carbon dioxide concentrating mechanism protein CcmN